MGILRLEVLLAAGLFAAGAPAFAGEENADSGSTPPIRIAFTPPNLEGRIVLGIFDEHGRLVRTMRPEPATPELQIGLNGYITEWDGRDESGAPCPAGRYHARGYVVGDKVRIEGEAYYFNDWMAEEGVPAEEVGIAGNLEPEIALVVKSASGTRTAFIDENGSLRWADEVVQVPAAKAPEDAGETVFACPGAEGTEWVILRDGDRHVVVQMNAEGEALRRLEGVAGEPQPVTLAAFPGNDAILLKEVGKGGRERVRLLRRGAASEADGHVVADWEVVFERSLQPCADFGWKDGHLVASGGDASAKSELNVALIPNDLEPKPDTLTIRASASGSGSQLVAKNGLKLLPVSDSGGWNRFILKPGGERGDAVLYQGNGIVVEEFSIRDLDEIAAYDAGSFLLGGEE